MFFNKRATELSMNVIIIAAISIMVLVILAVLVMKGGNTVVKGTGCDAVGGQCYTMPTGTYTMHNVALDSSCPSPTQHCYMSLEQS